jgi:hypothetical protein
MPYQQSLEVERDAKQQEGFSSDFSAGSGKD